MSTVTCPRCNRMVPGMGAVGDIPIHECLDIEEAVILIDGCDIVTVRWGPDMSSGVQDDDRAHRLKMPLPPEPVPRNRRFGLTAKARTRRNRARFVVDLTTRGPDATADSTRSCTESRSVPTGHHFGP